MNNKFGYRFAVLTLSIVLIISLLGQIALGVGAVSAQSGEVRARVRAYILNVRDLPVPGTAVIGQYSGGTILLIAGREDQMGDTGIWVYGTPEGGGLSGWVRSDYLEFAEGFDVLSLPVIWQPGGTVDPAAQTQAVAVEQPAPAVVDVGLLYGSTQTALNMRSGPGTDFAVIRIVAMLTPVALNGRSGDGEWLLVMESGQQGWLFARYVKVNGSVSTLPVVSGDTPLDVPPAVAPAAPDQSVASDSSAGGANYEGVPAGVIPRVGSGVRQIYQRGRQLGNRPNAFAKVGDSITDSEFFLYPIGHGKELLGNYGYLRSVIDFYRAPYNAFAAPSAAARSGWLSANVLDPYSSYDPNCQQGETPLACEYRLKKPAVALIMIGTNDVFYGVDSGAFRQNLARIVQISIDMGVIPILSTIPDVAVTQDLNGRSIEFNTVIASVAAQYGVPLWDYWLAMQSAPNRGLSWDNYHPSLSSIGDSWTFTPDGLRSGYAIRNLTALMVLDAVWRSALR